MANKFLMSGRHIHLEVILPSAFVERIARGIHALGHDPTDGEAICCVVNECLTRLFAIRDRAKLDELVRDGLFAYELGTSTNRD